MTRSGLSVEDNLRGGFKPFAEITTRKKKTFVFLCLGVLIVGLFGLSAQDEEPRNESKFTFGRVYFDVPMYAWGPIGASNGPPWSHDTPRSETHLMKIMAEVTKLDPNPGPHTFSFKTDECFKYPIAYFCEVGYLDFSEEEAHRMAEYLLRGGFLIVDDFRTERALDNFKRNLRMVFPDRSLEEVPRTDPIFNCFYDISNLLPAPPYARYLVPQYLGMRDDNGRLMLIADYNNDISEYWEWSDDPFMPIEETNEAFKYGVNYIMYALTH
ncbi:MAG TPA: DUF4159 domain-containing protein [Acidobacteriota bacterium]|nr:DUF4159 domain-containing protein [Acidobacteriota bacterium]